MKLTKIVLIIAAASFAAGSALAQEPIEPSYLGMRRGRYVPAPAPVPETFNWYIRADLGVGFTDGSASDKGTFGNGGGGALDNEFWAATPERINWFDSQIRSVLPGWHRLRQIHLAALPHGRHDRRQDGGQVRWQRHVHL